MGGMRMLVGFCAAPSSASAPRPLPPPDVPPRSSVSLAVKEAKVAFACSRPDCRREFSFAGERAAAAGVVLSRPALAALEGRDERASGSSSSAGFVLIIIIAEEAGGEDDDDGDDDETSSLRVRV